ncbi:hypothetical protein E2L08_12505 [Palleronia sediminis]|uniref:Uncharacterized protein n=1 Tax=Palleronia sediminis TaxID=2547833 RepID=A0A4R6A5Y4_9RHOB|nr:hypothetical protein [Palleronia sediminis]TDL78114.1 hypothetical protein E2L08_12505 [Palleronia sediminis]
MTPEKRLLQAIIGQAVTDLFIGKPHASTDEESSLARREALYFLTDATGGWARRRAELCLLIDYDPDQVRRSIIAILDGTTLPPASIGKGIGLARDLWAEQIAREKAAHEARTRNRRCPAPTPILVPRAPAPSKPIRPRLKPAKPWMMPPRDPEDDWLYLGIEIPA